MSDIPDILEGSCLCGRVRYRAAAPWGEMDNCHCIHCRKSHGAAFATYIEARTGGFEWTAGRENLETYMADTGASLASGAAGCQRRGRPLRPAAAGPTRGLTPPAIFCINCRRAARRASHRTTYTEA